jgi:tetratricopeptide (TPR) repeat protein
MVSTYKDFSLTDVVKRQLGIIIKHIRVYKRKTYKLSHKGKLVQYNPYTKENLTDSNKVCHHNTLRRLEEGIVKEDFIYHQLLQRLGLFFQIESENHDQLMIQLNEVLLRLIRAMEYIDIEQLNKIKLELIDKDLTEDCIADFYKQIMLTNIELLFFQSIEKAELQKLESISQIFVEVAEGFAQHTLGIYYSRNNELDLSLKLYQSAQQIYLKNDIPQSLIAIDMINIYYMKNQYIELKEAIDAIQGVYEKQNNQKQLVFLHNYLLDYYLLINHLELANESFNKAEEIIESNPDLEPFRFIPYFHWAVKYLADMKYQEVYHYSKIAYESCHLSDYIVQVAVLYLIGLTKNNSSKDDILKVIQTVEVVTTYSGTEHFMMLFKYFQLKYISPNYFRRYTHEKLIPYLNNKPILKDYLLLILDDFYNIM